ncbi:hypothetical protein JX265_012972 [Neoarthrinium moseri]|uniref:Uncharacterized protein n=1 Tax=Neoarthrinium moseri TaxID=1658444 RepID=A0A9P9W9D4_9PEZI|nr:hypothetical protein JX265_012972 [Neoarthrinium moseri]
MSCELEPNVTIGAPKYNAQYWQFSEALANNTNCSESTYLRPDAAGSIVPWPYALAWLLIHAPLVLIRVTRWQKVQVLSLVLAAISMGWSVEAYLSTQRRPEEVLVWTPLTIILDVGAVIQLAYLIVENVKERMTQGEKARRFVTIWQAFEALMVGMFRPQEFQLQSSASIIGPKRTDDSKSSADHVETIIEGDVEDQSKGKATSSDPVSRGKAFIVILSLLFFVGLVALQIIGLVFAISGLSSRNELKSVWCSPMFESFAIDIVDGNCRTQPVTSSASKGIGCIELSGDKQAGWIVGTVAVLTFSLMLEFTDLLILTFVESHTKWRGVKMKRPWCTMFCGIAILIFYVIYGLLESSRLPSGMTEVVWVFRKDPSLTFETACRGTITPAGVRGSMMGWTDGFLANWGRVYFG